MKRAIWIVLDGVGVGATPDAQEFGDVGAHTLQHAIGAFEKKHGRPIVLPHLSALGLNQNASSPSTPLSSHAFHGKCQELSQGKDTTSGHWEMAGLITHHPFATFPDGFPAEAIKEWLEATGLPGVLGNRAASGTEIIDELGEEHLRSGKPILYTSADSVWQVAAHETHFGLDRLYKICEIARKICDRLNISRVIARPFVGEPAQGTPFTRTYRRKDYALLPHGKTVLNLLTEKQVPVFGVGKIKSIFAGQGIIENQDTEGNEDGMLRLRERLKTQESGLIYCNLIDFDMNYGHRRNAVGFGECLEEFDLHLGRFIQELKKEDVLLITADHGNDPTFRGTDHTREYVPVWGYSELISSPVNVGIRKSFADMGVTLYEGLTGKTAHEQVAGQSFWEALR